MNKKLSSIEIFSGAGGLALGLSKSGFKHELLVEQDKHAVSTVKSNSDNITLGWKIAESNIKFVTFSEFEEKIDLVAGGPPCQPFSLGGKGASYLDERNMFPEAVRVVCETKPKAFVFENVKGLLRNNFSSYFTYVILRLTYPTLKPSEEEDWTDHLAVLQKIHDKGEYGGLKYNVVFRLLNAANYGIPQIRERLFIVGVRNDLNLAWSFPEPTHSENSLIHSQWISGEYWKEHGIQNRPLLMEFPADVQTRIRNCICHSNSFVGSLQRWRTVRDALVGEVIGNRLAELLSTGMIKTTTQDCKCGKWSGFCP
jgi:DNA (cytosine-5)-methyltransferase 1